MKELVTEKTEGELIMKTLETTEDRAKHVDYLNAYLSQRDKLFRAAIGKALASYGNQVVGVNFTFDVNVVDLDAEPESDEPVGG